MMQLVEPIMNPAAMRESARLGAEEKPQPSASGTQRVAPRVLLAARGLRKAFGGQIVLDGVDLDLRQGDVVLLRGENGSGKTTLLDILTGNLEPDTGAIEYSADDTPRTYRFPRRWWQELNPWDHFRPEFVAMEGMGRTWQDVRLFHAQSLRDNIAVATLGQPGENPVLAFFAPGRVRRTEREICEKADAMLARLGLTGRETSSADKISLGQSKRVAIARAVTAGARILFLDEPLAGLDQQGIANVLSLMEHLVREHGVTLVVVEHVFNHIHLHDFVTTDWLLEGGKLHPNGAAAHQSAIGKPECATAHRPWYDLLVDAGSSVRDESLPQGATLTRIRRADRAEPSREPVLEIRNLVVKRGSRVVIGLNDERRETGFNLCLFDGEIAVLQAPNGWGKSTLQAALCGLIPVAAGSLTLVGVSLENQNVWERTRNGLIALLAENRSFPNLTGNDVALLARDASSERSRNAFMRRSCSSMSGGETQRLMLRTVQSIRHSGTAVFVLDEPFAALDKSAAMEAARFIASCSSPVLVLVPSASV